MMAQYCRAEIGRGTSRPSLFLASRFLSNFGGNGLSPFNTPGAGGDNTPCASAKSSAIFACCRSRHIRRSEQDESNEFSRSRAGAGERVR